MEDLGARFGKRAAAAASPPLPSATHDELQEVEDRVASRTESDLAKIRYWDAGSPSYRWEQIATTQFFAKPISNPRIIRGMSLLNVAIYDAIVAAWDSKYFYARKRPIATSPNLDTAVETPGKPLLPFGARSRRRYRLRDPGVHLSRRRPDLPGQGPGRLRLSRRGRSPVSERRHGRARTREGRSGARDRARQSGRVRRRLDGLGAPRPRSLERDESDRTARRDLEAVGPRFGRPVPGASTACLQLPGGSGGSFRSQELREDLRFELVAAEVIERFQNDGSQ